MSHKSLVAGLVVVLVIGIAIGYFLQNGTLNISGPGNPFSGYTKVTLVVSQPNSIQFGNSVYGLGYAGPYTSPLTHKTTNQFSVVPSGLFNTKTFDAVQGATYRDLGLEIKVGEVHSDYLVLYFKSTVP